MKEARKTEYKGVVVRSKCEAIFAACLEIAGNRWEYEPSTDDGVSWDFYVEPSGGLASSVLVQYKPSPPSHTVWREWVESERDDNKTPKVLVVGNPFNSEAIPVEDRAYAMATIVRWRRYWTFNRSWIKYHEKTVQESMRFDGADTVLEMFGVSKMTLREAMKVRFDLQRS